MYTVDVRNSGGYSFTVNADGYSFVIDPDGPGCKPPVALLASLGSCIGVYIRKYAEGAHMNIGDVTISVEGELTKEKPVRFQDIRVTIKASGLAADERRKAGLLNFIMNCPVHNTLKTNPQIRVDIQ